MRRAKAARVQLIYTNGRVRRLEWTRIACIAASIGFLWWGWTLSQDYGLSPGDGGVLRSVEERFLVGGAVAALGVLLLAGIQIYSARYVLRIERTNESVVITTMGAIWRRSRNHLVDDFVNCKWHDGNHAAFRRVDAPWMSLSVAGMLIPYLIDPQTKGFNQSQIEALIRQR